MSLYVRVTVNVQADAGAGGQIQRGLLPEPQHEGREDPGPGETDRRPRERQRTAQGRGLAAQETEREDTEKELRLQQPQHLFQVGPRPGDTLNFHNQRISHLKSTKSFSRTLQILAHHTIQLTVNQTFFHAYVSHLITNQQVESDILDCFLFSFFLLPPSLPPTSRSYSPRELHRLREEAAKSRELGQAVGLLQQEVCLSPSLSFPPLTLVFTTSSLVLYTAEALCTVYALTVWNVS